MPMLPPFDPDAALRIAASRAALGGTVTRWLVHELRGPVQVLTLMPDLLDETAPPDAAALQMLRSGAATLERVTTALDDFLQRPPAQAELAPVTVDALLRLLAQVGAAHRGDVLVEADPPPDGLPAAAAVEGWLPHCLGVLLVNAIEACETQREGRVRIRALRDGADVLIAVQDDGPGFADGVAARVFEGHSTRAEQGWPRGLGLPVAQLLARRMGGDIELARTGPGDVQVQLRLRAWGVHL